VKKFVALVAVTEATVGVTVGAMVIPASSSSADVPAPSNPSAQPAWAMPLKVFSGPPAGADVLTASAADLEQWGIPPKPTDPGALAVWTTFVNSAKYWTTPDPQASSVYHGLATTEGVPQSTPPTSISTPLNPEPPPPTSPEATSHTAYSDIWAGWLIPSGGNSGCSSFQQSYSDWAQPGVLPGSTGTASFWNGIGGYGNGSLIQAGADSIGGSTPSYRFWTEDFPLGTIYEGPSISPGQVGLAISDYNGDGTTTFTLQNVTTGETQAFINSTPYYNGSSVEFINEKLGGQMPNYGATQMGMNAGTGNFGACGVALNNSNNGLKIQMTSDGTSSGGKIVDTGPYNSGNLFDFTWEGP